MNKYTKTCEYDVINNKKNPKYDDILKYNGHFQIFENSIRSRNTSKKMNMASYLK